MAKPKKNAPSGDHLLTQAIEAAVKENPKSLSKIAEYLVEKAGEGNMPAINAISEHLSADSGLSIEDMTDDELDARIFDHLRKAGFVTAAGGAASPRSVRKVRG